jgi:hypothetical protein
MLISDKKKIKGLWSGKSSKSVLKPNELKLVKELKFIQSEREFIGWLGRFSSLKSIMEGVSAEWDFKDGDRKEMNKQKLIKNFCLSLGEREDIEEMDKKKIFKIIQFSVKINKSENKIKEQKNLSSDTLNLLIKNKKMEIQSQNKKFIKLKKMKALSKQSIIQHSLQKISMEQKIKKKLNQQKLKNNDLTKIVIKKESSCQTQVSNQNITQETGKKKSVCFMCYKFFLDNSVEENEEVGL